MNIEIIHLKGRKSLKEYKSDIIPNIGDWFPGNYFEDGLQRTVVNRLICPDAPTYINVYVEYTYPILAPKNELTDAEADLLTQEKLS
jgi:hypothetical protein